MIVPLPLQQGAGGGTGNQSGFSKQNKIKKESKTKQKNYIICLMPVDDESSAVVLV